MRADKTKQHFQIPPGDRHPHLRELHRKAFGRVISFDAVEEQIREAADRTIFPAKDQRRLRPVTNAAVGKWPVINFWFSRPAAIGRQQPRATGRSNSLTVGLSFLH